MTCHPARIEAITPLTERIAEFQLARASGEAWPAFEAGSHIRVTLPDGDTRAYSLIRFTHDTPGYRIAVQLEPEGQGGSRFMHDLRVGSEVSVTEAKNDFPVKSGAPAVLLAGGIGVTPLISMAAALDASGSPFEFHYAGRSAGFMAYRDALADRFGERFHLHLDDDASALDLAGLIAGMESDAHLYVCGPRGMIEAAKAQAEAAGVASERIHFELFESAQPQEGDSSFEVEVASSGEVFTVPPGKSIIEVLEEGGVDVMYDCQRGDCGICQVDVLEGIPDHRDVVLSEAERASGKVMQICVSRAKSPRLKLDI
ncbi:PDR/VanB family oxidoreductase [Albibacillus kandeliae]|uniref:PDR/VanB family oxidoreductase n=1 Tax=Albibacillus kandeliae TaxID=2174228 RepID=UPI000D69C79D|nr:PDR/VanB family oxidoreductase [Albibacillus kandeliae]